MVVFLSIFDLKNCLTFCFVLLSDFFVDFAIWLSNQSYHQYQLFSGIALVFVVSIFLNLSKSIGTGTDFRLGLGHGMGESKNRNSECRSGYMSWNWCWNRCSNGC